MARNPTADVQAFDAGGWRKYGNLTGKQRGIVRQRLSEGTWDIHGTWDQNYAADARNRASMDAYTPQASGTMFNLAGVGQDPEMSNRVFQSTIGSTATPTPTAGTSPDFSLAAIGANAAGAFPADSGLTDRTGTSGAVGSYTGPPDIYGWEDGVKSGTVNRLDNGRSWIYRDGMGNVLGEIDKSMLAQNPASRAEREATLSTHDPVINPEPPPFSEPDPLPAGGIELGQELEGGLLPEETEDISAIASQIAGLRAAGANIDADALEVILGKINSDTVLTDSEFKSLTPELQSTVPEDLHPTQVTPVVPLVEEPELGEELEGELLLEEELDQDSEEEPVVEEPVVEEPELGEDLEVDLAETELPLAIAADGTELVGGLPLVDAYHAMKVGEGPVLTEAQISQLPPELLVEARAWMAANVDGPRQKAVTGPVDEVELGQDLEADLSGEEVVPPPAAKGAEIRDRRGDRMRATADGTVERVYDTSGWGNISMEEWIAAGHLPEDYNISPDGPTHAEWIEDGNRPEDWLPWMQKYRPNLWQNQGEPYGAASARALDQEFQEWLRINRNAGEMTDAQLEEAYEWMQETRRNTEKAEALEREREISLENQRSNAGYPAPTQGPFNREGMIKSFARGGTEDQLRPNDDQQMAWEAWEEINAYERGQNFGTTKYPAGDFGYWYETEWPRHHRWQDPGQRVLYDFPIIEDRRTTGSRWEDL